MVPPVALWLCLSLPLIFTEAGSSAPSEEPSSLIQLERLWTGTEEGRSLLDLDRRGHNRRPARGAEEEEQQSTFGHSFEDDSVTPPQATEFANGTTAAAGNASDSDPRDPPGLFNPFYPLADGSYSAYAVLFLAGLVLAVGVVGNMAVMCVVWNNYYMRSAWNYLLASMAFWDFLVLVLCLPVVVLNQLSHRRILGDITCRMVPYMEVGGACVE